MAAEGGGVFRHATLTASFPEAHIVPHGLRFAPTLSAPYTYREPATEGVTVAAVKVQVSAEIETDAAGGTCVWVRACVCPLLTPGASGASFSV